MFIQCIEYLATLAINGQHMSLESREGYCDFSSISHNFQLVGKTKGFHKKIRQELS